MILRSLSFIVGILFSLILIFYFNKSINSQSDATFEFMYSFKNVLNELKENEVGLKFHPLNEMPIKFWLASNTDVDCYFFGTSRSMFIEKQDNKIIDSLCNEMINLHGPTAYLINNHKFLGTLINKKKIKNIIIEVNPWFFRSEDLSRINFDETKFNNYLEYFNTLSEKEQLQSVTWQDLENNPTNFIDFFDINYLKINLKYLFHKPDYRVIVKNNDSVYRYWRNNGSSYLDWGEKSWRPSKEQQVEYSEIKKIFDTMSTNLVGFQTYDQRSFNQYVETINYLNKINIQTILFYVPFSSYVTNNCKKKLKDHKLCKAIEISNKKILELSKITSSKIFCHTDPNKFNFVEEDMMDPYHITKKGFSKCDYLN